MPRCLVAAGAALMIAPWMVRDAGDHRKSGGAADEQRISQSLFSRRHRSGTGQRSALVRRAFRPRRCPGNWPSATTSPAPSGRSCSRCRSACSRCASREGRLLWAAAIVVALPWLTNTGARFLMPARRPGGDRARHVAAASPGVGGDRGAGRALLAACAGCLGDALQLPPA